jgi:ketosteroid isomerase-like protein
MADSNETLLNDAYEALAAGDADAVTAVATPDVTVHIPGRGAQSGTYRGHAGVRTLLGRLSGLTDGSFHIELSEIFAGEELAVALGFLVGQRGGRTLDMRVVHVWRVAGGKLAEMWSHPADQYGLDAFFSGGAAEGAPKAAAPKPAKAKAAEAAAPEPEAAAKPKPARRAAKPGTKPAPISASSSGRSRRKPAG